MTELYEQLANALSQEMTLTDAVRFFEETCGLRGETSDRLLFESGLFRIGEETRFFFVLAREMAEQNSQLVLELSALPETLSAIEKTDYVSDETENRAEDSEVFFSFVRDGDAFRMNENALFTVRAYEGNANG